MIEWVENIFKLYIEKTPENVVLLLVLDSYWWYMMTMVVEAIQHLGVKVEHIPGWCTSLCKPIHAILFFLNRHLFEKIGKIVEWVIKACDSNSVEMVQHSWRHGVYSWFHEINEVFMCATFCPWMNIYINIIFTYINEVCICVTFYC